VADTLTLVIGAGIMSFIILYFAINQPDRHYLLKILGFFFVIYFLTFIPKAVTEEAYNNCTWVVNETASGDYELTENCERPLQNTSLALTKIMGYWWYLFVAYVVIYFIWYFMGEYIISWLGKIKIFPTNRKKRGRSR